jgi:hypothetical protein
MKRLLVLLAITMVTAGATGCSSWFNRGQPCGAAPYQAPCGAAPYGAATMPYSAVPATIGTPVDGGYLPAPG